MKYLYFFNQLQSTQPSTLGHHCATILFKYRLEKDNKAPDDSILKVMTEQWIKQYMIKDAEIAPSTASAVVAAESLTKAK
jgi:hypothetical protein